MASFDISYKKTAKYEGGYADNPNDSGGETYAGIARKFWPKWKGWNIIDQIKATNGISSVNKMAKNDQALQLMIKAFYKDNFWDVNKLDLFSDQQLADSVFDFGVNAGTVKAVKLLQEILNVTADSVIGSHTIGAVNMGNAKAIQTAYNCKRKEYYESLSKKPGQAQFLNSWISRLENYA